MELGWSLGEGFEMKGCGTGPMDVGFGMRWNGLLV